MKLLIAEGFRRDLEGLPSDRQHAVLTAVSAIPDAFREPARHSGLGLRKVHRSGVWEVRVGLDLRVVFTLEPDRARLLRVADHNEVKRYLRSL